MTFNRAAARVTQRSLIPGIEDAAKAQIRSSLQSGRISYGKSTTLFSALYRLLEMEIANRACQTAAQLCCTPSSTRIYYHPAQTSVILEHTQQVDSVVVIVGEDADLPGKSRRRSYEGLKDSIDIPGKAGAGRCRSGRAACLRTGGSDRRGETETGNDHKPVRYGALGHPGAPLRGQIRRGA